MKYFFLVLLTNLLISCGHSSSQIKMYEMCDDNDKEEREFLAEQLFLDMKIYELMELTIPCAENGDAYYQFSLGSIYISEPMMAEMNMKANPELAFKWFKKIGTPRV